MRNPTSCAPKQVSAIISSPGTSAFRQSPFQAVGCAGLPFKPKIALSLTGKNATRDGQHPGVDALVTQRSAEAGIKKAKVALPLALALDPNNAQALCEYAEGIKTDIEKRCPKGSIVGRATAVSPLLKRPLSGNVYFVKNIRKDAKTGRIIRTLPMLIVALRGEIAVNLKATSSVDSRNRLVNTFDNVPDATISSFRLNIAGGKNGILVVTGKQNVCKKIDVAEADTNGQNGRSHDFDMNVATPCKLAVLSRTYSSSKVKVRVGGVKAGRVTISGTGIKRTTKTLTSGATIATVTANLTKRGKALRKHKKALKVKVAYRPNGAKKTQTASSPNPKKHTKNKR
jgi:hypothetical protein